MRGTRQTWADMRSRCRNPRAQQFKNYGARGITICERWESFANFLADMGIRPAGFTLERIDNNGNYEPSNCRWATRAEQRINQRTCHLLFINGEALPLRHIAQRYGMKEAALYHRVVRLGWTVEMAVNYPVGRNRTVKMMRTAMKDAP